MNTRKLFKLFHILQSPSYLRSLIKGSAAGVEHSNFLAQLKCKTIVDVGANRGQFALVARRCFPNAMVHSIEPLDEPAVLFQKVFQNDPKVVLHRCAIGAQRITMKIHVSDEDDSSSLLPIGETQVALFPETRERETRDVSVLPLGDVIDEKEILAPALLKIDVQGFELTVLEGCQPLLDKFDYLYVECSFVELYEGQALVDDVIRFLHGQGFSLRGIYNVFYDKTGKAIQGDFFFGKN